MHVGTRTCSTRTPGQLSSTAQVWCSYSTAPRQSAPGQLSSTPRVRCSYSTAPRQSAFGAPSVATCVHFLWGYCVSFTNSTFSNLPPSFGKCLLHFRWQGLAIFLIVNRFVVYPHRQAWPSALLAPHVLPVPFFSQWLPY